MHQGIRYTCRLPPRVFPSAYCQVIRGEFIELEYTPSTVTLIPSSQAIPKLLKDQKSTGAIIATFFKPPVGALIAAMVSTFGIYLFASILYVSDTCCTQRHFHSLVGLVARSVAHVLQFLPVLVFGSELHQRSQRLRLLQLA